jgi:uncharacterized membrane protein
LEPATIPYFQPPFQTLVQTIIPYNWVKGYNNGNQTHIDIRSLKIMIGGLELLLIIIIALLCVGTIAVVVGVILWLSQRSDMQGGGLPLVGIQKSQENPVDILKRRYAQGEINKEEFDSMRQDLEEE